MVNPAVAVGLFIVGVAIAAALPQPLQEDRRASKTFRKTIAGRKTQSGGKTKSGTKSKK
jgi:hypothetical protein